jgi:hypothetical protein
MSADLEFDVAGPPADVLRRLESALQERPRRLFGMLKVRSEFIGVLTSDEFEVWERRQRAVHAVGAVRRAPGGSRVSVHFRLTPVSRMLTALFFFLYVLIALGLATQSPNPELTPLDAGASLAGALFFAALFYAAARRQRRDLRRFLQDVLSERRRPGRAATSPSGGTRREGRAR